MFERFIRIDDKTFSFAELAKLVGIDNDNPMISLVQEVYDGVLEASCDIDDEGPNPGIDILHRFENASQFPTLLTRAEQNEGESVRTLLFGQNETCIAYTEVQEKTCIDHVVVSGCQDRPVQVFAEDVNYVQYWGELNPDDFIESEANQYFAKWRELPNDEWECSHCGAVYTNFTGVEADLPANCPHCHTRMATNSP